MKFLLLVLAVVLPGLLEASLLRAETELSGDGGRAKIRHRLVQEKLVSEMKKFEQEHLGKKLKPRQLDSDEDNLGEGDEDSEEGHTVIVECSGEPLFKGGSNIQEEQDDVWQNIVALWPAAQLVSSSQRLVNALYVKFPASENKVEVVNSLHQIEGVIKVTPHGSLEMEVFPAVEYIGGYRAQEDLCASGRDVRVAVLDGGVDYTHKYLGGEGTREAWEEAYGLSARSVENRRRDGVFPTETVVDGYDFMGEFSNMAVQDDDPIDRFGHGTAVSHAILTVAPNAKLIGLKVCGSTSMSCPVFAIIQGLEFALDPNGDDDLDDKVDVVNLSLGTPFVSPFYNFVAAVLETVFELGVLPVVSAGNSGNIPYVLGGISGSPNSLSVGATGHPNDELNVGVMANYSSRGPGENNMLAPEIVAPSGLTLAAAGTGVFRYRGIQGTSFSAPLVAGAAALVMERCPECSPFAIKSLLMNNANRGTRYNNSSPDLSPITLSGAGELQVGKALQADVWAYSVEDVQPSISLGLIDAASNVVIQRTIKVVNLSDAAQTLRVSYQIRNPQNPYADALGVSFNTPQLLLPASCNTVSYLRVTFTVDAARAPPNHMTSAGRGGFDPKKLDLHEFGGHIILEPVDTTPAKDLSIPFVAIIRRASEVTLGNPVLGALNEGINNVQVDLSNQGAGIAQVDAFQLLLVSGDDPESSFGESVVPNDFKYIGFRVLEVGKEGCTHLVEFAINTWERKNGRLVTQIYGVDLDLDDDEEGDRFLYNSGLARENLVVDLGSGLTYCTGMPPDHGTSSTNTILRACSEELGIADFEGEIGVRFEAATFSHEGVFVGTDESSEDVFIKIDFPRPGLSMRSFDLVGGDTLQNIEVERGGGEEGEAPLGLMLVTNSYRNPNSTGAASPSSETLVLLRKGFESLLLPTEITPDVLEFPVAEDLTGPQCSSWKNVDSPCDTTGLVGNPNADAENNNDETLENPLVNDEDSTFVLNPVAPLWAGIQLAQEMPDGAALVDSCPSREVHRPDVLALGGVPVTRGSAGIPAEVHVQQAGGSDLIGNHDNAMMWDAASASVESSAGSAGPGLGFAFLCIMTLSAF